MGVQPGSAGSDHAGDHAADHAADPCADAVVHAALGPLDALGDQSVHEHPEVLERVHADLRELLAGARRDGVAPAAGAAEGPARPGPGTRPSEV